MRSIKIFEMEDNFENELKKQGDAYKVQPREWVWPRVEAELDKKKERRIAAWWWMAPLLVLMLGGGYLLINKNKTGDNAATLSASPHTVDEQTKVKSATTQANKTDKKSSTTASTAKSSAPALSENPATPSKSPAKEIAVIKPSINTTEKKNKQSPFKNKSLVNPVAFTDKNTPRIPTKNPTIQSKKHPPTSIDLLAENPTADVQDKPIKKVFGATQIPTKTIEKETILSNGEKIKTAPEFTHITSEKDLAKEIIVNNYIKDSTGTNTPENSVVKMETDSSEKNKEKPIDAGLPNIAINTKKNV